MFIVLIFQPPLQFFGHLNYEDVKYIKITLNLYNKKGVPWTKLILTTPVELAKTLKVLVVVKTYTVQAGGAKFQQCVVCRLLFFTAGVAVEKVVDFISNLCGKLKLSAQKV